MLRKTVTVSHGNAGGSEAAVAERTDTSGLAAKTAAALSAADQAAADQAARDADAEAQAKARARAKSGIRSFSGCSC